MIEAGVVDVKAKEEEDVCRKHTQFGNNGIDPCVCVWVCVCKGRGRVAVLVFVWVCVLVVEGMDLIREPIGGVGKGGEEEEAAFV